MATMPKYDFFRNPVYQIDFHTEASGKRLAQTKRRVKWRFGFSNADALAEGYTGVDCRGEEHEVSLVWSLTSGKRLIVADGAEVHFSQGKRTEGKFEASWNIAGGHIIKVIAHAAPPVFHVPGFRQFDLLLDGCSYFNMPKIYQLGTTNQRALAIVTPPKSRARRDDSEECYESFAQPPRQSVSPPREQSRDLLVLEDAPPTTPAVQAQQPRFPPAAIQYQAPTVDAPPANVVTPTQYSPYNNYAYPALANEPHTNFYYNYYPETQSYTQQQPHYNYNAQVNTSPMYQEPVREESSFIPEETHFSDSTALVQHVPNNVKLTMQQLSLAEIEAREQPELSEMDRALSSLVNLEDLEHVKESPEKSKTTARKHQPSDKKSMPQKPTTPDWHLGPQPSLAQIQAHKRPKEITKEIFNPRQVMHHQALVVYGQPQWAPPAQWAGAPTLYAGY